MSEYSRVPNDREDHEGRADGFADGTPILGTTDDDAVPSEPVPQPEPYFTTQYNHDPVVIMPEVSSDQVDREIARCADSNKWQIVGAQGQVGGWRRRVPLHTLHVEQEDDEGEATRVSWGGVGYVSSDGLTDPNVLMMHTLSQGLGMQFDTIEVLPTIRVPSEDGSHSVVEILRYPIDYGWTIDVAVITTSPNPESVQVKHRLARSHMYDGPLQIEQPMTYLNAWACPPGMGLEQSYTPSDKGDAREVAKRLAGEVTATQPMDPVAKAQALSD